MHTTIRPATAADIPVIQQIAWDTWPLTYGHILSPEQLAYMLQRTYSAAALAQQMTVLGHGFLLAASEGKVWGFVAYEPGYQGQPSTRIHKLYVLPDTQGRGIGRLLLDAVCPIAQAHADHQLELNVNRNNRAIGFYEKYGFRISRTEDIDIGQGFWMEDYVMVCAI